MSCPSASASGTASEASDPQGLAGPFVTCGHAGVAHCSAGSAVLRGDDGMSDDTPFAGEVALVTGASSGIGVATARRFARDGASVVLAARSAHRLDDVASDLPGETLVVPTDVTDPEAVAALAEATEDRFGRIDTVVVNAGTGERRNVPLADLPLGEFETVTETNVHGAFYTVRATLPVLRESEGTLAFVGSYKSRYPSTSTPVYAASKWWLRGFAASVAGRVGPDGVGVTLVNPSGVPTAFGSEFRDQDNADRLDPDRELAAADVADAIAYAARQDAPATVAELDLYRRDVYERF